MRRLRLHGAALLVLAAGAFASGEGPAAGARASEVIPNGVSGRTVSLHAALSPKRLGRPSTIAVRFHVSWAANEAPSPVTEMRLMLPAGMSISTSELGLATCAPGRLTLDPIHGCPRNSQVGVGEATAVVPFGTSLVSERVKIALYSGPLQEGDPLILASADGKHPVIADIVFGGRILGAGKPFGSALDLTLPIVPGLPGGPDVALVSMATSLGSRGIIYTETVHGKLVRFHPKGIVLPARCPAHGFPFALGLTFADGTQAGDEARVPCPRARSAGRRGRGRHGGAVTRAGRELRPSAVRDSRRSDVTAGARGREPVAVQALYPSSLAQ